METTEPQLPPKPVHRKCCALNSNHRDYPVLPTTSNYTVSLKTYISIGDALIGADTVEVDIWCPAWYYGAGNAIANDQPSSVDEVPDKHTGNCDVKGSIAHHTAWFSPDSSNPNGKGCFGVLSKNVNQESTSACRGSIHVGAVSLIGAATTLKRKRRNQRCIVRFLVPVLVGWHQRGYTQKFQHSVFDDLFV